jgi:hypothetical protein
MFRRGNVFWVQDNATGKQSSLGTKERGEAERLLHAKNEAHAQPIINMQIARAYLMVGDPEAATRTWQKVMDEIVKLKHGDTQRRWLLAVKDKSLDGIRNLPILETRPEHFLRAMEGRKVSTNVFLRRIHNFSLGMNWLPVPVIPKRMWPTFEFKDKRAITLDEHRAIVAREGNPERRAFYDLAWHIGASQSDIAFLEAENIDWENQTDLPLTGYGFSLKLSGNHGRSSLSFVVSNIRLLFLPSRPTFSMLGPASGHVHQTQPHDHRGQAIPVGAAGEGRTCPGQARPRPASH